MTNFSGSPLQRIMMPRFRRRSNHSRRRYLLVLSGCFAALSLTAFVRAGEFNRVLTIGDSAPSWEALPSTDGRRIALTDLSDAKVVVVVFTCNSCPYAADLDGRLVQFDKRYQADGVMIVAVNVNKIDDDLMPAMKAKAERMKFRFPYLFDQTQEIAKQYGAKYTPECFVLDQNRKIAYLGAFDDSPDGKNVNERYVEQAVDAVLAGQSPTVTETVPIGCRIRMERKRRRKTD